MGEVTPDLSHVNAQLQQVVQTHQHAEAMLRQALQFHEKVLETTSNAIAVVDVDGRLSHLNARALELTGYTREELEGRSFAEIVPQDQLEATAAAVFATLRDGTPARNVETDIQRKDGQRRTINFSLAPMWDGGQIIGAVGTADDVTERLRAKRELEKYAADVERSNKELAQFAYVASHDLQEPLRVVAGYLQLLETQCAASLPPEARRYIERSVNAIQRMHGLIHDLLSYARIGSRETVRTNVSMEAVLDKVRENLAVALTESGARLAVAPLPTLWADSTQMTQVFQNLIGNALKFRGPETSEIQIQAHRVAEGWRFSVQDNGIGIAPDQVERVFQIFQRLHTRNEFPGNGIGLAICQKIVENHGGRIWIEPGAERGTIVHFTIPDLGGRPSG